MCDFSVAGKNYCKTGRSTELACRLEMSCRLWFPLRCCIVLGQNACFLSLKVSASGRYLVGLDSFLQLGSIPVDDNLIM